MIEKIFDARTGELYDAPYTPSPNDDDHVDIVPASVSRFQARAALMDRGLLADAEAAIASAGALEQLAWAEATEWRRDSPTIAAIGASLGLTALQMDDLFRYAATIRA